MKRRTPSAHTTPTRRVHIPMRLGLKPTRPGPILRRALPAALRSGRGFELKSVDSPVGNAPTALAINTTANFQGMNLVQSGAAFYNRIGRKITMRTLHFTAQIQATIPGAVIADGIAEYLRILIIYDRQPNGNFPVVGDILANYDNAGTATTTAFSNINMNNSDRFKIIRDIRIAIPTNDTVDQSAHETSIIDYTTNRTNINEFIRLGDLETQYSTTTNPAAIGDITTGSLFVMTYGSAPANNAGYTLKWSSRLRYRDT